MKIACALSLICLSVVPAFASAPTDAPKPILRPIGLAPLPKLVNRPTHRPVELAGLFGRKNKKRAKGPSVCGARDIIGKPSKPISSGRCGIDNPVRVTSIAGVTLTNTALVECETALALRKWLEKSAKPALKRKGGGLVSIRVAASYACRTRNSQKGGKLSEHALGRAVDVSSFTLKKGQTLTVLKDWNGKYSKEMRAMHKGACGIFGTVLGPKSDKYHQDHFHFDTARYRSGAYCR